MTRTRKIAPAFTCLCVQLEAVDLPPLKEIKGLKNRKQHQMVLNYFGKLLKVGVACGPLKLSHIYAFDVRLLN